MLNRALSRPRDVCLIQQLRSSYSAPQLAFFRTAEASLALAGCTRRVHDIAGVLSDHEHGLEIRESRRRIRVLIAFKPFWNSLPISDMSNYPMVLLSLCSLTHSFLSSSLASSFEVVPSFLDQLESLWMSSLCNDPPSEYAFPFERRVFEDTVVSFDMVAGLVF